jgi:hypothetical protein
MQARPVIRGRSAPSRTWNRTGETAALQEGRVTVFSALWWPSHDKPPMQPGKLTTPTGYTGAWGGLGQEVATRSDELAERLITRA